MLILSNVFKKDNEKGARSMRSDPKERRYSEKESFTAFSFRVVWVIVRIVVWIKVRIIEPISFNFLVDTLLPIKYMPITIPYCRMKLHVANICN